MDLTKWFDPIVISAECGFRKPDSRIFRLVLDRWSAAAERAGEPAVERHQVVMVGDRTSRDVIGARRVGMRAVLCVLNDKQAANYAKSQVRRPLARSVQLEPGLGLGCPLILLPVGCYVRCVAGHGEARPRDPAHEGDGRRH